MDRRQRWPVFCPILYFRRLESNGGCYFPARGDPQRAHILCFSDQTDPAIHALRFWHHAYHTQSGMTPLHIFPGSSALPRASPPPTRDKTKPIGALKISDTIAQIFPTCHAASPCHQQNTPPSCPEA